LSLQALLGLASLSEDDDAQFHDYGVAKPDGYDALVKLLLREYKAEGVAHVLNDIQKLDKETKRYMWKDTSKDVRAMIDQVTKLVAGPEKKKASAKIAQVKK